MKLIKYGDNPEKYLNMDFIECINKDAVGICRVWMIGSEDGYEVSESAYNTILKYGKAEV